MENFKNRENKIAKNKHTAPAKLVIGQCPPFDGFVFFTVPISDPISYPKSDRKSHPLYGIAHPLSGIAHPLYGIAHPLYGIWPIPYMAYGPSVYPLYGILIAKSASPGIRTGVLRMPSRWLNQMTWRSTSPSPFPKWRSPYIPPP